MPNAVPSITIPDRSRDGESGLNSHMVHEKREYRASIWGDRGVLRNRENASFALVRGNAISRPKQ